MASSYTEHQWQRDLVNKMSSLVLNNINWLGVPFNSPSTTCESSTSRPTVRVLDYACGPGTVTGALTDHATEYIGIDLSDGMVNEYNSRFTKDASSSQQFTAHAVVGNLLEAEVPQHLSGSEYSGFDLAAVGVGFHHFPDVQVATDRLVERLEPGGVLMIIDFLAWEASGEEDKHHITHNGFTEARVKELFGNAGLVDVGIVVDDEKWQLKDRTMTGFIARGRKPKESK